MKKLRVLIGFLLLTFSILAHDQEGLSNAIADVNLVEVANLYTTNDIQSTLYHVDTKELSVKEKQNLALYKDLGFLKNKNSKDIQNIDFFISSFKVDNKNYLGYISDKSIYEKILKTWHKSKLYNDKALTKDLLEGLKAGNYTGFNIIKKEDNANFNKDLTITYGHSNISHAIQLLALLKIKGIEGRVQLEPKTSAYVYMKDWGTPKNGENYFVDQSSDKWIAYAKEYNLVFEFEDLDTLKRFNGIINKYAKKDSEKETGLLLGSWWQPLYYTTFPLKNYMKLSDNISNKDGYDIHIFSLEEKSQRVLNSLNSGKHRDIYVNKAFHNYMLGEYK